MVTALTIIAALAVMGMIVATVFVAVTFRQALQDIARSHDLATTRQIDQLSSVLDRFQAIDWESLVAMRSIESAEQEGGFFTPEEQAEDFVEVDEQTRWGALSRMRVVQEATAAERELLEEDFPEDFNENR